MKKVIALANKDALPPLVTAKDSYSAPALPNVVTPIILKAEDQGSSLFGSLTKPPSMRLIQTADGKKILLTNVVATSKTISNKTSQFLLLPTALSSPVGNSFQPQLSLAAPASKRQAVYKSMPCNKVTGENTVMFQLAGSSQPFVFKQESLPVMNTGTGTIPAKGSSNSAPVMMPLPLLNNPVISTSNTGMYINNGLSRFKVIGKPVPIALGKNPLAQGQTPVVLGKNPASRTRSPIKIAPKGSGKKSSPKLEITNENVKFLLSPKSEPKSPASAGSVSSPQLESPVKPVGLPSPPAYLNIQIKEEPEEEKETKIKLEENGPMSILDVRIKEELGDDQNLLLENDEQLRDILNVATEDIKVNAKPKFYIRTPEGKLVSITSEEAETIGLNPEDKAEDNQKRLVEALRGVPNLQKQVKSLTPLAPEKSNRVLIPNDVNLGDFVSCHISEGAIKAAALMKNFSRSSKANSQKNKDNNPVIVGEFTRDEKRYMRIRIQPEEFDSDICDILISPFNTYQCPFCRKEFKTKDHVISHIRIHTGERPYPCDVCGKRYRQRIDIIRHMRIHTGEKPFTCGLCNASFNQKSNLRSHMRIHTGERPVQCKVCGKGFSRNTHLKQHLKLHTGEKPYKCKVCSRPFRFKSGLQAHERIHTGLKPYACSLCGRSFTQIVGLIRHERTHRGEKPFRCQSCGKSFDDRDALQGHCKKHTDDRPHACQMCNKTFIEPSALRSHMKKYHTNTLICVICHREDFKTRIDLREHLREHERENWEETADGDLVPSLLPKGSHYVSIDDIAESEESSSMSEQQAGDNSEMEQSEFEGCNSFDNMCPEEIQVEVELDPDDPLEDDDEGDSEYEEHELLIESDDPLAC